MMGLKDFLVDKQVKSVTTQMAVGVIVDAEVDEDNDYTGLYTVMDSSSGVVVRCYAMRCGNTKFVYPKGTQVIIAYGVEPASSVGCVIIGQLAKEYPDEAKVPSDYALDEGETATKNPISGAGIFHYSDGSTEVRGKVATSQSVISLVLGGLNNFVSIALNAGAKLISLTPDKVLSLTLKSVLFTIEGLTRILAKIIEFETNILRIFADESIVLHSNKRIGIASETLEQYVDKEYSVKAKSLNVDIEKLAELVAENIKLRVEKGELVLIGSDVKLGGEGARYHVILGERLLDWLRAHTHTTPAGQSGPPSTMGPNEMFLSGKVKVE